MTVLKLPSQLSLLNTLKLVSLVLLSVQARLTVIPEADAVKFQKRDIESVYSEEELNKYRESPWGTLTREQKHGIEFDIVQYKELEKYTDEKGLDFIVSCWDLNSLQEVEDNLNVKYHKVASAMATDKEFLEKLHYTGKSIILSTGMCTCLLYTSPSPRD